MTTANVYLKDGGTAEVPIEALEDYLHDNADKIESRHHTTRRARQKETLVPATANK
jgi:hypothetical protein